MSQEVMVLAYFSLERMAVKAYLSLEKMAVVAYLSLARVLRTVFSVLVTLAGLA